MLQKSSEKKEKLGTKNSLVSVFGISYHRITMDELHTYMHRKIREDEKAIIGNHNLHSIYLYHKNPPMRQFIDEADVVHADGMPLVLWARLLGYNVDRTHRVTYVDWVFPLMNFSQKHDYRVFFLGSEPGVADKAVDRLKETYPGLKMRCHHGFFDVTPDSEENKNVIEKINDFDPHILMVGMGMPRQEKWLLQNINQLKPNIYLCAGACMEYVAGVVNTPPRWMGKYGLEWLFRLVENPFKFWRRYLVEPWSLVPYMFEDLVKNSKYQQ